MAVMMHRREVHLAPRLAPALPGRQVAAPIRLDGHPRARDGVRAGLRHAVLVLLALRDVILVAAVCQGGLGGTGAGADAPVVALHLLVPRLVLLEIHTTRTNTSRSAAG